MLLIRPLLAFSAPSLPFVLITLLLLVVMPDVGAWAVTGTGGAMPFAPSAAFCCWCCVTVMELFKIALLPRLLLVLVVVVVVKALLFTGSIVLVVVVVVFGDGMGGGKESWLLLLLPIGLGLPLLLLVPLTPPPMPLLLLFAVPLADIISAFASVCEPAAIVCCCASEGICRSAGTESTTVVADVWERPIMPPYPDETAAAMLVVAAGGLLPL